MDPASADPQGTGERRDDIPPRHPDLCCPVPAPISARPNITRRRRSDPNRKGEVRRQRERIGDEVRQPAQSRELRTMIHEWGCPAWWPT